jgi:ribosomal-protein-alanine N-acetyltransferase
LITLRPLREVGEELERAAALDRDLSPVLRTAERYRQLLRDGGQVDVAVCDGGICAVAAFARVLDEATLLNIAVAPAVRGQGVGRRLLASALPRLCQCGTKQLFLEVRPSNRAAIALYRSLGFRDDGLRPNYYAARAGLPTEDALLMSLSIEENHAGTGD